MALFGKKDWKETEVKIEGMHCKNCVARMTKAFLGAKGVKEAQVSLEGKCAHMVYDGSALTEEDLKEIVTATGFTAA